MLQSLKNGATSLAILEGAKVPSCCEGWLTRTVDCTEEEHLVYEASATASALDSNHMIQLPLAQICKSLSGLRWRYAKQVKVEIW